MMEKTAALPRELYEKPYQVGLAVRDLRADVEAMHAELSDLAEAPSRLALRRFKQRMLQIDRRAKRSLATIAERFTGDKSLIQNAFFSYEEWNSVRAQVVEAIRLGNQVEAYTLTKTEGYNQVKYLEQHLELLTAAANAHSRKLYENANLFLRLSQTQSALITLVALLCVGGAVAVISVVVIRPVREISDAMKSVADGNLSTVIPHDFRCDEIGQIARSSQVFLNHAIDIQESNIDFLTGLPKRRQILQEITSRQITKGAGGDRAFLLHIDLDGFVQINDVHGRDVGDCVLKHVASHLRMLRGPEDFIAREGADSFVWYRVSDADKEAMYRLAQMLQAHLDQPIEIEGHILTIECSIGIALADRNISAQDLLLRAENACIETRCQSKNSVSIYTDEMDARLLRRREILRGLRFALDHDEIVPFFQPQVDARTGELRGFECLVRWRHPEHGTMAPWQFLQVAQDAGLLGKITEKMIHQSLAQLALWRSLGFKVPRVSLNLDASDLGKEGFADRLMFEVDRHGLEPTDLCLELLESAMIEDGENPVSRTLNRLGDLGFPIELDDFGTGHAAIASLRLIALRGIKIDRSFVTKLHERPGQTKLTKAMLRLAHALQIQTVAEGVESSNERDLLVKLGCDVLQGYGIGRPMSGDDATLWLEQFTPDVGRMRQVKSVA